MEEDQGAGPPPVESTEAWKRAIDAVVPCVVVLKVTLARSVDTEGASSSYATGFCVDKKRGLILTNRHVVTPGPIVAEAIFLNREELECRPVYYDPVHDFAFLKFDPTKLQFMELREVPLAPQEAAVGLDIRVVGNDSGEKVSILAGVLARLDRDAPVYGRKSFNDFNTFYLQAASGTKGGSSGSPVIDIQGRAVGLNAGGRTKAASAYYLPLERVVRAVHIIQACNEPGTMSWSAPVIPRGDLQTTFTFKGFDEVRRLGLQGETEKEVRLAPARQHGAPVSADTTSNGMLIVESVVPGSPADGWLEPGDVLVRVNRQVVTHFLPLEEVLDDAVGREVTLDIERGGKAVTVNLTVTDLHSVTPSSFLELCGGSVHALSYQQARNNRAAVGQVYVAEAGYMLSRAAVPKHAIITQLSGKPTPNLEAFAAVLRALPHGARVPLEYFTFAERHRRKNVILHIDRQWYGPPVYWTRDDAEGTWHPTTKWPPGLPEPPAPSKPVIKEEEAAPVDPCSTADDAAAVASPKKVTPKRSTRGAKGKAAPAGSTDAGGGAAGKTEAGNGLDATKSSTDAEMEERLRCALVLVDVDIPLVSLTDGVHARCFAGNGLIVHHSNKVGLVLVDRNTVAVGPVDVVLSFGAHPAEIPGQVRFLHPLHNFALVSYDPAELPAEARTKVHAAQLVPRPYLRRGDQVYLAGLTKFLRIMQRKSTVTTATSSLAIATPEVPRFRAVHEEVVKLDQDFGATFSGVLADGEGRVRALWGSYGEQVEKEEREWCAGLQADVFEPWVSRMVAVLEAAPDNAPPPPVRTLDAELEPVLLSKAAQFHLPGEWVSRLDRLDPERRQVLRVRNTVANSHAAQVLKSGDMLLAMAGKPVTCFRDVEALISTYNGTGAGSAGVDASTGAGANGEAAHANGSAAKCGKAGGRKRKAGDQAPGAEGVSAAAAGGKRGRGRGAARGRAAKAAEDEGAEGKGQNGEAKEEEVKEEKEEIVAVNGDCEMGETQHESAAAGHTGAAAHHAEQNGDAAAAVGATGASGDEHQGAVANGSSKDAGKGSAEAVSTDDGEPLMPVTIFRGGEILELKIRLGVEDGMGTSRIVHWCGAQLQAPHRAVRELGFLPDANGVYISRWHHGSPAHRYGLYALHWILEVNGIATPDLDTFVEVTKNLKHGDFVRVKVCHLETTQFKVLTLKLDLHYWPTWELRLNPKTCSWERIDITQPH